MTRIDLFAACLFFPALAAAAQPQALPAVESEQASHSGRELSVQHQLDELVRALTEARADAKSLRAQIAATKDDSERQQLEADLRELNRQIDELVASLEKVATRSADLELFEQRPDEDFNWKHELEEVFQPLLVELKRLTERPRKIERLRSEQALSRCLGAQCSSRGRRSASQSRPRLVGFAQSVGKV